MSLCDQIRSKAERKLLTVYRAAISGEGVFPWVVPLNRSELKDDLVLWRNEVDALREIDKSYTGVAGPVVLNKILNTRKFGTQKFPDKVIFESQNDFLEYLGKKREFSKLMKLVELSRARIPTIEDWLRRPSSPNRMFENQNTWEGILEVCEYFLTRENFSMHPRLFPLSVHTKFIEENKGILGEIFDIILPCERKNVTSVVFEERYIIRTDIQRIALRIPDESLRVSLGIPFSELEVPTKELSALIEKYEQPIQFLIIENKTSYLTFPKIEKTIIIFGSGFLVSALEHHKFLNKGRLLYWGDIDAHGLEILSLVREQFPHTETFLMSEEIITKFWNGSKGKPSVRINDPVALSTAELKLYRLIRNGEKRFEQEKLAASYIEEAILQLGSA